MTRRRYFRGPNRDDRGVAMYRLFDDAGRLLYVGISNAPGARFKEHSVDKEWWGEVADHVIVWHPTRDHALTAESDAIWFERPIYNKSRPTTEAEFEWENVLRQYPDLFYLERWCLSARECGVSCIWPQVLHDIHAIVDRSPRVGEIDAASSAYALLDSLGSVAVASPPTNAIQIAIDRLDALLPDHCSCLQCWDLQPPED